MRDRQEHKVETTLQFDQPVAMAAVQPKDSAPPRTGHDQGRATADARYWMQILSNYRTPSRMRSIVELVITAVPLVALWTAAWFAFSLGHAWASLLIAIPAGGFLVRLFMIQHDCGHGTFFAGRQANDWVGRVLGVLTLTPY
ncbi:MAG: fatty acid desaturase, partial [Bradyrhizobium sp.]|nr:fatty acid desaturase [Bradyrhizobium sp.]